MKERRNRFEVNSNELERRKQLIVKKMVENDISLIMATALQPLTAGYVRYISGFAVDYTYISPNSVLLTADGEVYVITTGNPNNPFDNQKPYILPPTIEPGVNYLMKDVYYQEVNFSMTSESRLFEKTIKHTNSKKVGMIGLANFSNVTMDYLKSRCPDVEFIDFTEEIDAIKAVKSSEEIDYISKTSAMLNNIIQAVPSVLSNGIFEWEIGAKLTRLANDLGSENTTVLIASGKQGSNFSPVPSFYQNRQIESGDQIRVELRMSGPGGFFGTICRDFILDSKPDKDFKEALNYAVKYQKYIASIIKPSIKISELQYEINQLIEDANNEGIELDCKVYGQGYDLVERPLFNAKETMDIQENMVMCVQVSVNMPKADVSIADDFLILDDDSRLL